MSAVDRVIDFQRAAYRLVRRPAPYKENAVAIVELAARARQEPELASWCQTAVWIASKVYLETGRVAEPPGAADPVTTACRALRLRRLERCPECKRRLPSLEEIRRWDEMYLRSLAEFALATMAGAA